MQSWESGARSPHSKGFAVTKWLIQFEFNLHTPHINYRECEMKKGQQTVGHPVDVASGTVYSTHKDIDIPGKVDLTWERYYTTALLDLPSTPLGSGWTTRYFCTLTYTDREYHF